MVGKTLDRLSLRSRLTLIRALSGVVIGGAGAAQWVLGTAYQQQEKQAHRLGQAQVAASATADIAESAQRAQSGAATAAHDVEAVADVAAKTDHASKIVLASITEIVAQQDAWKHAFEGFLRNVRAA